MERDGSGVSALLGLGGFVVRAQLLEEATDEWWLAVETCEERAWCPSCGRVGGGPRPPPCGGAGSADRGSAGGVGVGQALVALRRGGLRGLDVVEESDAIAPRAVLTEPGTGGDLPAGRTGRAVRGPGGPGLQGCRGTRPWLRCATTAGPGSVTWPVWVPRARSGRTRPRS
jgi:hypothetical protein